MTPMNKAQIEVLNELSAEIHQDNVKAGWWTDLKFRDKQLALEELGYSDLQVATIFEALNIRESLVGLRNVGELLCLIHSEISEAMEGHRKNLMDDKLPHRKMIEAELSDAFIRMFDLAGALGLDVGNTIAEKRAYNANRADHKIENRLKENGKKF